MFRRDVCHTISLPDQSVIGLASTQRFIMLPNSARGEAEASQLHGRAACFWPSRLSGRVGNLLRARQTSMSAIKLIRLYPIE